jgi:hypothetical protein
MELEKILNSYNLTELKKHVRNYNAENAIKGYSKLTKEELIKKMLVHGDKFKGLKMKEVKEPVKKVVKKIEPKKKTESIKEMKESPIKKEAPKKEMKKEAPKKEVKKEEPKKEMKKEEPKKEAPKKEMKKEEPKKEVKEIKKKIEEKKFIVEPEKKAVENIIKAPEQIEKVGRFSYDKIYFNELDRIEKTDRLGRDETKIKLKNDLMNLQFRNDLYTTPKECIDLIFKNIVEKDNYLYYLQNMNVLEPSAGTGRFIRHIIDMGAKLKINNLDANEYTNELYTILKDKTKISNVYNKDFLTFEQDKDYQLIVMNPPYSQYIDNKDENKAYLFHLVKAILLKSGYEKLIYIICPEIKLEGNMIKFEKAIAQRIANKFDLEYNEDDGLDLPLYQIEKIGECKGFIKYNKGRTSKMGQTFYIYNIVSRDL